MRGVKSMTSCIQKMNYMHRSALYEFECGILKLSEGITLYGKILSANYYLLNF